MLLVGCASVDNLGVLCFRTAYGGGGMGSGDSEATAACGYCYMYIAPLAVLLTKHCG